MKKLGCSRKGPNFNPKPTGGREPRMKARIGLPPEQSTPSCHHIEQNFLRFKKNEGGKRARKETVASRVVRIPGAKHRRKRNQNRNVRGAPRRRPPKKKKRKKKSGKTSEGQGPPISTPTVPEAGSHGGSGYDSRQKEEEGNTIKEKKPKRFP